MSTAGRRQWWGTAVIAVLGGVVVIGGWAGLTRRAIAEPKQELTATSADVAGVWTRSPTPPADPGQVVPASATVPAPEAVFTASTPVPPVAGPRLPDTGLAAPPAIPPLPGEPPTVPPAPVAPAVKPVLPPPMVEVPAPPEIPVPPLGSQPPVPPAIPIPPTDPARAPMPTPPLLVEPVRLPVPPAGGTPAVPTVPPASITPPAPSVPPASITPPAPVPPPPAIPTPGGVVPPLPAVQFPEPPLAAPPKPDSALPGGNAGTSVKAGNSGGNAGPMMPPIPVPEPVKPVAPIVPIPEPGKPSLPPVPAIPVAGMPGEPPGRIVDRPKPSATPGDSEKFVFPLPNTAVPTPGDSTMVKFHHAAAVAVLGGALLTPPSQVGAAPPLPIPVPAPVRADDKTDVAELKRQLEESNRKLGVITEQLRVLTELLNGRKDEKGFPLPSDPGIVAEMKALKDKLAAVEKELNAFKTQTALRPPAPTGTIPGAAVDPRIAPKGIVQVINEYPIQISMVVNGTSYRVAPSKSLDIEVPAGEFTYQLLESGAAPTRSVIKDRETVKLRIK